MDIKCHIPVFAGDKRMLKTEKEAVVAFSLKPELKCCEINSVELHKDEKGSLYADFRIPYEYDQERKLLMVSAPDYEGEKCFQAIFHTEGDKKEFGESYQKEALEEWSKESIGSIYREILAQAEKEKVITFIRCNWDEERGEQLGIGWMKSTYGGVFVCHNGTNFWNVIGSTSDVKISKSWIEALNFYVGEEIKKGIINVPPQHECIAVRGGIQCARPDLVGGHVVFDPKQVRPISWAGGTPPHGVVGLLPICKGHNHSSVTGAMTAAVACPGIWLDNYSGKD